MPEKYLSFLKKLLHQASGYFRSSFANLTGPLPTLTKNCIELNVLSFSKRPLLKIFLNAAHKRVRYSLILFNKFIMNPHNERPILMAHMAAA